MLLTSAQIEELSKGKVNRNMVVKAVHRGELKDYGKTVESKKKHVMKFDSKEVKEWLKGLSGFSVRRTKIQPKVSLKERLAAPKELYSLIAENTAVLKDIKKVLEMLL